MSPRRRLLVGLGLLATVVVVGIVGYMIIEDAGLADALFMVVITITTV